MKALLDPRSGSNFILYQLMIEMELEVDPETWLKN